MFDALRKLRLRLLSNSEFRSKAQKIPVIQGVANRSAERLFGICSGFVQSQVLLAFIQARLNEALQDEMLTAIDLANQCKIPPASMAALLQATSALGLTERVSEDRYQLGELGAVLIDNPGVIEMIKHHHALYKDLADPLNLLQTAGSGGNLQRYWAYANTTASDDLDTGDVSDYTQLMAASQQSVSEQVLAAIDLGTCRHLLDVGGGNATFAVAAATKWPRLRVTVADLPPVVAAARQNIAAQGVDDRVDTVAIDFKRQQLPSGHDALSFVRILHDHDDADVRQLLQAAASSLPADGLLVVAEPLAEATPAGRLLETYFSMYLLAMGQGRLRRQDELRDMLEAAGFHSIRRLNTPVPLISSVLSGRRKNQT